jgi:hypothetical protein
MTETEKREKLEKYDNAIVALKTISRQFKMKAAKLAFRADKKYGAAEAFELRVEELEAAKATLEAAKADPDPEPEPEDKPAPAKPKKQGK